MKILKRIGKYALKNVERMARVINQLPDRRTKLPESPHHREKKYVIKGANPVAEKITLPNHRRDRKPKGPPHSETMIYNHPRG